MYQGRLNLNPLSHIDPIGLVMLIVAHFGWGKPVQINPNNFIDWIMQLNFNLVAKATEIIAKEGKFDVIHAHDWLVANAAKTLKNSFNIFSCF